DARGDLGDLDGVGHAGAQVVVLRRDEHLALPREPPPGPRVLHAVEVALEAETDRVGVLSPCPIARADRARGTGRERRRELGLAPFTRLDARAHPRTCTRVREPDSDAGHAPSGAPGCDIHTRPG